MVYSKAEIRTEKAFISGVCTNTPTNFTPIIEKPKIVAGYWKIRGSTPNPRAMPVVVRKPYATYNMVFTLELQFLKMLSMITSWRKKTPGMVTKT